MNKDVYEVNIEVFEKRIISRMAAQIQREIETEVLRTYRDENTGALIVDFAREREIPWWDGGIE